MRVARSLGESVSWGVTVGVGVLVGRVVGVRVLEGTGVAGTGDGLIKVTCGTMMAGVLATSEIGVDAWEQAVNNPQIRMIM